MRIAYKILVEKCGSNRARRRTWSLVELWVKPDEVDWIQVAQVRVKRRLLVNEPSGSFKSEEFLEKFPTLWS
jgi:hypothetical protein